jgi:hypothetical protein
VGSQAERARPRFLIPLAIVVSSLLSAACAGVGLLNAAMIVMCYMFAPGRAAAVTCTAGNLTFAVASGATLAIPVAIGLWARQARGTRQTVTRISLCLAGYLVPVLLFLVGRVLAVAL